jgi:K+-sensing histidine kinase KdpD
VFQRFYRLESSRSTPGSGLGLSLVEAIAALHGVSIELADNGPGLRVTLRFLSPDQRTSAGDRPVKQKTQGKPWVVKDRPLSPI